MVKNFEWKKKDGEEWSVLEIKDINKLTLDQSLKVQEMWDNKNNQRVQIENQKLQIESQELQIKTNNLIVILTAFSLLTGLVNLDVIYYNYNHIQIPNDFFTVWGIIFLISFVFFLYQTVKISDQLKKLFPKK